MSWEVLRRQLSGRLRWDHADRLWLTALSRLVHRHRWPDVFPIIPATILRRGGKGRPGGSSWPLRHTRSSLVTPGGGDGAAQAVVVLVFIEHGTRRLHLAGVTRHSNGAWAVQQARNLAMDLGDHLDTGEYLIHYNRYRPHQPRQQRPPDIESPIRTGRGRPTIGPPKTRRRGSDQRIPPRRVTPAQTAQLNM